MAVAFTSLASWEHAQDTTAAQEIILAYSERRQCVGDAAIDALEAGDVKQDATFWRGMQDWIETNCVKWVDYDATITGGDASLPVYTITSFRSRASLPSTGFRRATEWPTDWTNPADAAYSFGKITAGDIVGPWIFEDMQAAFDAMRWSIIETGGFADYFENGQVMGQSETGATMQDAIDALIASWDNTQWFGGNFTMFYSALFESYILVDPGAGGYRQRGSKTITGIADHLNHSAVFYANIESTGNYFNDCDFSGPGWFEIETFTSSSTTTRVVSRLSYSEIPIPSSYSVDTYYESESTDTAIILKWDFTNTL